MILGFRIKIICYQIMLQLLDFLCFIEVANFCFVESRVPRRKLWWYHFIHRSKNVDVIACPNVTILNRLSTVSMISSLMYRLWWINRLIKIYRNTCSSGEKNHLRKMHMSEISLYFTKVNSSTNFPTVGTGKIASR